MLSTPTSSTACLTPTSARLSVYLLKPETLFSMVLGVGCRVQGVGCRE
jgi:hypothetical protein